METLGYGRHFIIDGFQADAAALADGKRLERSLNALAHRLEPEHTAKVQLFYEKQGKARGVSGLIVLAEAYLSLHGYPEQRVLCLNAFSRRGLSLGTLEEGLRESFGAGRFESHLSTFSKTVAKDEAQREVTLRGDRSYAFLRLCEGGLEPFM